MGLFLYAGITRIRSKGMFSARHVKAPLLSESAANLRFLLV